MPHPRALCSKGTYIRSLAHEIGRGAVESGAHLTSLRRTRSGALDARKSLCNWMIF